MMQWVAVWLLAGFLTMAWIIKGPDTWYVFTWGNLLASVVLSPVGIPVGVVWYGDEVLKMDFWQKPVLGRRR